MSSAGRIRLVPVGLLVFALMPLLGGAEPVAVRDAARKTLELAEPARRIVSLAPHVSELLFEIGAGGQLVGAVQFSDYPEAAKLVPRVGDYKNLDLEALLALEPDLVIGWLSGNRSSHIEQIRRLGIPVFLTEPRRLRQIPELMRALGELSGRSAAAARVASRFETELDALRNAHQNAPSVRVFFQAWAQPLMTLNGDHLVSDAIRLCGGENVFADLPMLAPTVTVEAVLNADPQLIVTGGVGKVRSRWLEAWKSWPQLQAVKNRHLYLIDPDLLQRPTSRIVKGIRALCGYLDAARQSMRR